MRAVCIRAALLVAMVSCSKAPTDALRYRESWELLGHTDQGSLIDARGLYANTDLLRGQAWLSVDQWTVGQTPITLSRAALPANVSVSEDRNRLGVGPDFLGRVGDAQGTQRWTAHLGSMDASAIIHLLPGGPPAAPAAWQEGGGQWTLTAPITQGRLNGWIEAGERGGVLQGHGVLLHHGGDGWPTGDRLAAFVFGAEVAIGVDQHGRGHLAWAQVDGQILDVDDARITRQGPDLWTLDFDPGADLVVQLKLRGAGGRRDPLTRPSAIERSLLRHLAPLRQRTLSGAQATILYQGRERTAPAMTLRLTQRETP